MGKLERSLPHKRYLVYERYLAYQRMLDRLGQRERKQRRHMPVHGRSLKTLLEYIAKRGVESS